MASSPSHVAIIAVLVVVGLIGSGLNPVQAQTCQGLNYFAIYSWCWTYLQSGTPQIYPSATCCKVVKRLDTGCVCMLVSNLGGVDPVKGVYVAKMCGNLPSSTKCGS